MKGLRERPGNKTTGDWMKLSRPELSRVRAAEGRLVVRLGELCGRVGRGRGAVVVVLRVGRGRSDVLVGLGT